MPKNFAPKNLDVMGVLWRGYRMLFVGLTGSIATGKSSVAKIFSELGFSVIDADYLAHKAYEKGQKAYDKIVKEFGSDILDNHMNIDRKKLGKIVLQNKEQLSKLESIVHPEIEKIRNSELKKIERVDKNAIVIYDIPLLFEKNLKKMFDVTIVVYTDKKTQIERLMKRDGLSKKEAEKRIDLQIPVEQKIKMADFAIDNSKDIDYTKKQVEKLAFKLRQMADERG